MEQNNPEPVKPTSENMPNEDEALKEGIDRWQKNPGHLEPGINFVTGDNMHLYKDDPSMMELTRYDSQKMNASRMLLHAVGKAPLNDVTLYRGTRENEDQAKSPMASWTTSKKIAEGFAAKYGGKVITAHPNTVQAFKMPDTLAESEYLVKRPEHPYWTERHPGHTVGNNPGLWDLSEEWKY
jgi:hypothetical protein